MEQINKFNVLKKKEGKYYKYYTQSIYPGFKGFSEKIIKQKGLEFREVDPKRSKLIAAIAKGLSQTGIKPDSKVLYLGASHGYTPSFVSDIVGKKGVVFCLDFAPTVVRDLIFVCEQRENMIPLLKDAKKPETYKENILPVDVIFQDVAQRDQVQIFLKNIKEHLKQGGFGLLALKSRSIDVTKKPTEIFNQVRQELQKHTTIVDQRTLEPFEKDHAFFVIKKK